MSSMQPVVGSLLIASAALVDPNFARCVLLVIDSDENGSLGVILNRPSMVPVGEILHPWQDLTTEPGVLFRGGPVEPDAALALGWLRKGPSGDEPVGWRPLSAPAPQGPPSDASAGASWGIIDLDSSPDELLGRLDAMRVYAGYTGWGAGQLEDEIAEGSWHVVPSTPADPFSHTPERLWAGVLRRQPPPLSMMATMPEDANLN